MIEVDNTDDDWKVLRHLRDLRKQLYEAYYRRSLDTWTAARLTQAAFDRFRLPMPENSH